MSRRSVWCFTVLAGKHSETGEKGVPVLYNNKTYTFVLGPVEKPDSETDYDHQHGYIHCPRSVALTKGQAISILKFLGAYTEDQYVHELEKTRAAYHSYCFKSIFNAFTSAERRIKRAVDEIHSVDNAKLNCKRLKLKLMKTEGADFVVKNNALIALTLAHPEAQTNDKYIHVEVDEKENVKNFLQVVTNFQAIVDDAIHNSGIETTHRSFNDATKEDQLNAIMCIALLPMMAMRVRVTDQLPALWFYGMQECGKSFLFSQIPNYKRVATDAEGVSRFKLGGDQTAFFLDDIDKGWLFKMSNSATLKTLAIGEKAVVKTHGDTMDVRGFVVITSNHKPDYLCPMGEIPEGADAEQAAKDHKFNCGAWKRRVVSLEFAEHVDFESVYVDYEMCSLDKVAKAKFVHCYNDLASPALKELFKVYFNHVNKPEVVAAGKAIVDEVLDTQPLVIDDSDVSTDVEYTEL